MFECCVATKKGCYTTFSASSNRCKVLTVMGNTARWNKLMSFGLSKVPNCQAHIIYLERHMNSKFTPFRKLTAVSCIHRGWNTHGVWRNKRKRRTLHRHPSTIMEGCSVIAVAL